MARRFISLYESAREVFVVSVKRFLVILFMKTFLYFLLLLLPFVLGCNLDQGKAPSPNAFLKMVEKGLRKYTHDKQDMNLKGKIKGILELGDVGDIAPLEKINLFNSLNVDNVEIDDMREMIPLDVNYYQFSRSGKVIKELHQDESGTIALNFQFDKRNNILFKSESNYDEENSERIHFTYDYQDRLKRVVVETDYKLENKIETVTHFNYMGDTVEISYETYGDSMVVDEPTRKVSMINYPAQEKKNSKYEYNDFGQVVKRTSQNYSFTYEYNDNGDEVKFSEYDSIGNLIRTELTFYDNFNKFERKVKFDSSSYIIANKNTIDYYPDQTSISARENELEYSTEWENKDKHGNVIKNILYSRSREKGFVEDIWTYEYKYDHNNNWVSKKSFNNDDLVSEEVRRISYY